MSAKNDLLASLRSASAKLGGAHLTRQARDAFCRRLAVHLHGAGFRHLRYLGEVGLRHVRSYVTARQLAGVGVRTPQNDLAHLRGLLALAGRPPLLSEAGMTNQALGVAGGSRIGAKTAIREADYAELRAAIVDDGLRALVALERSGCARWRRSAVATGWRSGSGSSPTDRADRGRDRDQGRTVADHPPARSAAGAGSGARGAGGAARSRAART
ncbi:MAG: hypothetical protein GXC76_16275 [Rhodanobacteraceae bacterium]|nr:hypothetical protein [Rhodanobacteraceae bacterium]